MQKQKKTGIGHNKQFGPIQKLSVPDFQHISNQYEMMQNEILEKPTRKRRPMKQFTIRKATNPNARQAQASADMSDDMLGQQAHGIVTNTQPANGGEPSLLTEEENAALKPKEVKVTNPWIYEQTHQEYLDNIKGLPARHANVIKKHHDVQREKTFLEKVEIGVDKDQASKEAIALLDKEYEIFREEGMPGVKVLTRYDTWDEDRTIEQWVEYCQARKGQAHALSPVYQGYEYCWKPVEVISYDHKERKYRVRVVATGQEKLVTRLSLLFFDEDPDKFKERVNLCKHRQEIVQAELRFTNLVDTVPTDSVSTLSKERRFYFLSKSVRESDKFDPDKIYTTFKHLLRVVEEEYIRQMKKCVILKEMEDPDNFQKFQRMKIPIRLSKKTSPFFGVVRCPKYPFQYNYDQISNQHFSSDADLVAMTRIFIQKCIDFQKQRIMNTNMSTLKLPRELTDLKKIQSAHHGAIKQNMMIQWRDFLIGEIQDKLRGRHNFYEGSNEAYEMSPLKRIISRFEYILNTYLREFVDLSIKEWVKFIKLFTNPNLSQDELWKVNTHPFIIIHLSVKKKEKKKKDKKKPKKEDTAAAAEEDKEESDEDDKNRVIYSPSLEDCQSHMLSSMDMVIDASNSVNSLEADLMPFLQKKHHSNFSIDQEFPWISEANDNLNKMYNENIGGPNELLDRFKKYEYILNIDKKKQINDLFKAVNEETNEVYKKPMEDIKKEIEHFELAHYEIMTLAEDEVDFRVFRAMTKKMKEELGEQAIKHRDRILDETYKYCTDTVSQVNQTYVEMLASIRHEPINEKELIASKDFSAKAPMQVVELTETLEEVKKHYLMLEEFSYMYKEQDIDAFWLMKQWPIRIQATLTESKQMINDKNESFSQKLETEKESFSKELTQYQNDFTKIREFKSLDNTQEFSVEAFELSRHITKAFDKVKQFHDRETTFGLPETPYPDLDDIDKAFKPFYDLITMAQDVKVNILEWTQERLMTRDSAQIAQLIGQWQTSCMQLYKKLIEDYPETAEVAQELKANVDQFSKNLPLIKAFTSDAITDEDWNEIQKVVEPSTGEDPFVQDEVKVSMFSEFNLYQYIEEIEEIEMRAAKKAKLANQLKTQKDEMKNFNLELGLYKEQPLKVMGKDDINGFLDEQIVQTQQMLGSSFMKGRLKAETKTWEGKLNHMSELIDEIFKVQKGWMYLEPIFGSGDIGQTLPMEYKMFVSVDTLWRNTMKGIEEESAIQDLAEKENIKVQFEKANNDLDKIQKSLSDYLEQKRLVFARFFFLANDDLLQILAQTKDPTMVQDHMDKCFEGIQKVQFDENQCVYGMISAEQEIVGFNKKVDVNEGDKKGNVELWMLDIEAQMIASLKSLAKQALDAYPKTQRTEWSKQYPGQIVLQISQIYWTTEVEQAIKDYEQNGLEEYIKVCQNQIEDIVQMVRKPLKDQERITLKALVVIDVHARDVVIGLNNKQIQNPAEFDWTAQLRYYWEKIGKEDSIMVKMVTAEIPYAYEYLGNSPRLVITELTDRCYRTLLGAKYLNYGGAPEGPAGTGKTESVKDLAKAIAVQCVVFNCSDGLDYLAMAKFFKGLAASGAWCCFDEFNRIDLEVLSVIAQQIQCIQSAIKDKKRPTFVFEKTELKINRACAVNITMNPGYAGRSELPDNLKALFRPCAMMVPDYAVIAQIELYSFGFSDAAPLSVKVVSSLRLSSEQLSSQFHYDFGMRAVKSILTACGNQRRLLPDWPEDLICLKALNDVNIPKFTSNDIPLYKGITSDLFPGIKLPEQDYAQLFTEMKNACKKFNLQPKDIFLEKCIQLYETIMVRHGLMVVGDPYAGKSSVIKVLQEAMSSIKDDPKFVTVDTHFCNPKAITQNQLYGVFDLDTQEWSDGVLAIKIREAAESQTPNRKWICFDGPVDAVWIENMNTVLDDNKKLCLNSGQIIKLRPTMTIMFQVDDLSQASPATVSRCGMVLNESAQLGHSIHITSYCDSLRDLFEAKTCDKLEKYFHYIVDLCVEFTRTNCKFHCPGTGAFVTQHIIRMIKCYVQIYIPKTHDGERPPIPGDIDDKLINALIYSTIWGIGGCIEENTRAKFDEFLQDLLIGTNMVEKHNLDMGQDYKVEPMKVPNKLGDYQSLFELYFDQEEMRWVNWMLTVDKYTIDKDNTFLQLNIPTIDTIRVQKISKNLLENGKHVLLVGFTGTGKSISINQLLRRDFDNDEWNYYPIGFSAQTSANETERIIDGKMDKKRKGVYGPALGKEGVIFVDDLNMPQKQRYGAQPPIELLRQWMDYQGWYDIDDPERNFRKLTNVRFAGAMGPPGNGRNSISSRYIRHFNVIYIEPYSGDSLRYIFSTVMDWLFVAKASPIPWPDPVKGLKDSIVATTIIIYEETMKKFKPTPAKAHYTYNLRDVSKIFQGIAKSSPKAIVKEDDMLKLWAHECLRVFQDRLISIEDRDEFLKLMKTTIKDKFKKEWSSIIKTEPLLFASFVPLCYPAGDTSKKPYRDVYCELYDREKMKKVTEEELENYNTTNPSKKMQLVLFTSAIEHVVKIHRIITTEFGHALLIGVGGSGRKSLTELAVSMATFKTFQIEITNTYRFNEWRDDMRKNLFMECGVMQETMVFLLNDTQIIMESFLEDVNNVLNNGEIPNLYSLPEDIMDVMDNMRETNKNVAGYKNLGDQEIWQDFISKCKNHVHIVLAMSPIGDDIKRRLRMFPSLVNCCAIDWFLAWPKDALKSVAEVFIRDVEDLPEFEGIIDICVDMQLRVTELTTSYFAESKIQYYVTPTSYLVLIQAFKNLLAQKRNDIDSVIMKYERGIDQLAQAKKEVKILQEKLTILMPQLTVAKEETAKKIIEVDKQKKSVAEIRKGVEKEEAAAKEKKVNAEAIQKDCEFELSKVMPIYNAAIRAVQQLKKDDITELKNFAKPPPAAVIVAQTLCIMFGVPPKKVGTGRDATKDYWDPAKKQVLTGDLLKRCTTFDKDNISPAIVEELKPIIASDEYEDKVLKNASNAAWGLAKWIRAMVQYDDAMKVVKPKQAELKEAKEQSAAAQAIWDEALEKLKKVEAEMQALIDDFDAAKKKEQELSDNFEDAQRKCERAKSLIEKLAGEEISWDKNLKQNREDKLNLVGDVVISSGVIAYLGVFSFQYRDKAIEGWTSMLKDFNIKGTENFSLREVIKSEVKIQQWFIEELPQEGFAVENAIIMDNSERWPLMIDPQMQGNNWIKNMHKELMRTIKPTQDPKIKTRAIKLCIQEGYPLLLEDSNETFDPILEPVLGKMIDKKNKSNWRIKIGDDTIDYDKNFKFYITTKLPKPHFSPEVCVKVTMLNFMVTYKGLEDQMLNIVVTHEDPNNMKKRNEAIIRNAANQKKKGELEDKILNQIATSETDILEDDVLLETLDESKAQCKQIDQQLEESQVIMRNIENIMDQFRPVALRVSRLFFVLIQVMNVDPMYQYSLKFYKMIFGRALENGSTIEKGKRNEKMKFFIKEFTRLLYENICRSLFEKDKLLFSFLICLQIMNEPPNDNLDQSEVRFIMTGGTRVDMKRPNPTGEGGWMSDKIWASILQLDDQFEAFKGISENVEQNLDEWERIYGLQKPQSKKANWPAPFQNTEMTLIRQAMFLRVFRPDKVIQVIQKLVKKEKELGPAYIVPPPFDMDKSFSDSTNKTPIIIVLSAGADPMGELQKLAEQYAVKYQSVSLGQGQAQIACDSIAYAIEAQEWVILQNCHLCPSFMPTLDGIIEEIEERKESRFRLWLTAMPSDKFPVTILQNGIKATIEPPKGLKNNILRSYLAIDEQEFESCDKPTAYKSLMWGLCFFNALILERRKFGPLGWNIPYEFSNSDLSISQMQLMVFLNHYENIPWEALRYMVAEANYGGRVTDPKDRLTINVILEEFYNPQMLKTNHKLVETGKYWVPSEGPLSTYQDFIRNEMPLNDYTEIFGLHDNAEITSAINTTNKLLEVALSLQQSASGGAGGKSQDDILREIAEDILNRIPKNFDMEYAAKKHPIKFEDSMNTVLQQELLRYNNLTKVVRESLINVGKAIKGEVPLSVELEELCTSLQNNQVPDIWHKRAYPSLKPLASWVLDFLKRLKFCDSWVEEGAPASFWVSGFFFTQSFFTGSKQNYARKYVIAIDQIDMDFKVIDEAKTDTSKPPDDGVYIYGLFVEGCRWDERKEALEESNPKVLYTEMKMIHIMPKNRADIDYGHSYCCPVYKQARRAGTLSTTGHSTNFVLDIYLPMQKKHTHKHWIKRGVAMLTMLSD